LCVRLFDWLFAWVRACVLARLPIYICQHACVCMCGCVGAWFFMVHCSLFFVCMGQHALRLDATLCAFSHNKCVSWIVTLSCECMLLCFSFCLAINAIIYCTSNVHMLPIQCISKQPKKYMHIDSANYENKTKAN
jgi:hypothetical protein